MLDASSRLLRLLAMLESRREWTGAQLAGRLAVSTRTVRNDMGRLRSLGYPIAATPGVAGGYRLGAGGALPPLLLEDDEAVAVVIGLRTAAGQGVAGMEESAVRALVKLEQVLPVRLRHRVSALQAYTVAVRGSDEGVDPQMLTRIAAACRDSEVLWADYVKHDGTASSRALEPHRLVSWGRRWYLVAWDRGRSGWRTFRVDRLRLGRRNGSRFIARELPAEDLAGYVRGGIRAAFGRVETRATVHAPAGEIMKRVPPDLAVEPVDANTCLLHAWASTAEQLAIRLGMLDADFEVKGPPELIACLERLSARYASAGRVASAG